jgi:ParB family chromosome partitioning protein
MADLRKKILGQRTKLADREERLEGLSPVFDLDEHQEGDFYNVPIDLIKPNPHQPRQYFDPDSLTELSNTISARGVLQPIIVRIDGEEIFLVAGERRLRAAKMAGLDKIPTILTKGNPAEIALIENLHREDLNPIEEAEAFSRMIEEFDYTQEKLAMVIGKARPTITNTLSLIKLPDQIKDECSRANIPKRVLVEIARQDKPEQMLSLFNQFMDGSLKSDQVREAARKRTKKPQRSPASITLDKALSLDNHLAKLDPDALEESEKGHLLNALKNLRTSIDKFLD